MFSFAGFVNFVIRGAGYLAASRETEVNFAPWCSQNKRVAIPPHIMIADIILLHCLLEGAPFLFICPSACTNPTALTPHPTRHASFLEPLENQHRCSATGIRYVFLGVSPETGGNRWKPSQKPGVSFGKSPETGIRSRRLNPPFKLL